ncbi:unnamed protein product [Nippostrongylus brasiliensis]|uniref:Transposase n=1 Tax=Nippostrongylus brasiliensis TaxID=27835 RepID=A0A0N4YUW2_NIPBR|nr:unnamed protein product [Nippostrongylus brasiliensis]
MSLTKLRNINNSKEADILGSNASKCRLGKWSDNIGRKASTTADREEKLKKNWLMIRVIYKVIEMLAAFKRREQPQS